VAASDISFIFQRTMIGALEQAKADQYGGIVAALP
jgi:hypothetical protein